jgi:hypothetical protein
MRLKTGSEGAIENPERKGRLRKFGAAVKRTTRRAARNALFIGSLLVSGLMLSGNVNAEEKTAKRAERALSVRAMGGAYNKGQDPYLGVGLSGHLDYEHVKFDATLDGIFRDFKGMGLDHAELDITFPIKNKFAFSPFVYRSIYFGNVEIASGVMFHIPKINLHICPHWFKSGDTHGFPIPIVWTPSVGDRLNLLFKVIVIANNSAIVESNGAGPLIGVEVRASVKITDNVKVYGRVFEMTARDKDNNLFVGTASTQVGVEMDF